MSNIENWASPGMPPEKYTVIDRNTFSSPDSDLTVEHIWIDGEHPHKGTVVFEDGKPKTFVEVSYTPSSGKRFKKLYSQKLPHDHPLHDWQLRTQNKDLSRVHQAVIIDED